MAKDIKVDGPAGLPLPTPTKKTSIKRTISFTGPDAEAQAAQYREAAKNDAKLLGNKSLRESVQQRNAQVVVQKRTDATKANLQPSPNKTDPTAPKSGPQALDDAAATAAHTTPGQMVLTTTGASEILKQLKQITLPKPGQDRPDADLVKSLLNKLGNVSSPMSSIGTDANAICNFMMNMELAGFPMGEMSNLQIMLLLLEIHAQDKDLLNTITMTSHMSDIAQKKLQEKKVAVSQMFEKLDLTLGSVQGSLKAITSSHEAGNKIGEGILQVKSGVATEAAHAAEGRIAQRNAEAETMGRGHATDRALGEMHATPVPTPPPAAADVTGNGPLSLLLNLPPNEALARLDTTISSEQATITRLTGISPLSAEQRTELTQARGRLAVGLQRKADFLAVNPRAGGARGAAETRAAMEANLQALDAECGRVGRREIEERIQEIRRDELPAPPPAAPTEGPAAAPTEAERGMTQLRANVARGVTDASTALRSAQVDAARLEAPAPATDPVGSAPLGDAAVGSTTGTQDPTLQALYDTPPVAAPATPPAPPATVPSEADRRASAIYARALPAVERERAVINNPSSTPAQRAAAHGRIQATLQRASDACRARGGALPEGLTAATAANEQAMERLIGGTGMLRFNEANLTRRQADLAAVTPAPTRLADANHQLNVERATVTGSREAGALEAVLQQRIAEAQQARFALESFRLRTNAGSHMSEAAKDATASARAQVYITREFGGPTSRGVRQAREARDNYASTHPGATTSNDPVFQRLSERADRLEQARQHDIREIDATIGRIAGGFTESSDDFSGGLFSELETLVTQGRLSREDADRNVAAVNGAMQHAYRTSLDPNATSADVLEAAVGVETASGPAQDQIERDRLSHADRSEAVIAADLRLMADRRSARASLPALMRTQTETARLRDAAQSDLELFDSLHPEVQRQTTRPTAAGPEQTLWDQRRVAVSRLAVASGAATRAQTALDNVTRRVEEFDRALQHMRLLIRTEGLAGTGPTDTELVSYAERFNAALVAEVAADVQRIEVAALRAQRDLTPSEPGDLSARPAIATRATVDAELTAAMERLRPLSTTERAARRELQLQENAMTRALEGWQPPPANARPPTPAIPAANAADPWRFYDEQLIDADLAVRYGRDTADPVPEALSNTARDLHAVLDPVMETGRAIHGMTGTTGLDRTRLWNSINFSQDQTAWAALTAPAAPATPPAPGAPAAAPAAPMPPHAWPPTSADLVHANPAVREIANRYLGNRVIADRLLIEARIMSASPQPSEATQARITSAHADRTRALAAIATARTALHPDPAPATPPSPETLSARQTALSTAQADYTRASGVVDQALARGMAARYPTAVTIQGRSHDYARATESSKYPSGWGWLTGAIGLLGGISGFIQPFGDKLSAHRRQVTDIADELRQRSEQVAAQAKAELQNANARLPAETRRMFDLLRELSEGVSKGR